MARDPLGALHDDILRLLPAGGALAPTDAGLRETAGALAALSARVPALEPLDALVRGLLSSEGRAASVALLNLGAAAARYRGAQARLFDPGSGPSGGPGAAAGDAASTGNPLEPLPVNPPLAPAADHEELAQNRALVLTTPGGARALLARPFDARQLLDVRMLGAWFRALADDLSWEHVRREIVARLGAASAVWLLPDFDERGGIVDGRRLECLADVLEPRAARALVDRALERGSKPVRAAALRALASLDPAGAEPVAIEFLEGIDPDLRVAAAGVLARSASDRVLELLLAAAGDEHAPLQEAALSSLAASVHPAAGARTFALLTADALAIRTYRGTSSPVPEDERKVSLVMGVIRATRSHMTDERGRRLVELARGHRVIGVRELAAEVVLEAGTPVALTALATSLGATQPYQPLLESLARLAHAGESRAAPALLAMLDRIDKSDRYVVYHAITDLGDAASIDSLRKRGREKVLDERERALLRTALDRRPRHPEG
jgi:HEAT repeat protein